MEWVADLLEIQEVNYYPIRAYREAAQAVCAGRMAYSKPTQVYELGKTHD